MSSVFCYNKNMGKVFSIEEFSVFDGDGIRTTVFLKGCPLRCSWCHSPEGQSCAREYLRSPNGCLQCGKCLNATFLQTGKRELSEYSVSACPRNLVRSCGEEYTSEKLVEKLEKNLDILNGSGGGVTFSGGEPLMQADFLFECLTLLQGKTNRGLQTTGFCKQSTFEKILTQTDLVLYDLKLSNFSKVGREIYHENPFDPYRYGYGRKYTFALSIYARTGRKESGTFAVQYHGRLEIQTCGENV